MVRSTPAGETLLPRWRASVALFLKDANARVRRASQFHLPRAAALERDDLKITCGWSLETTSRHKAAAARSLLRPDPKQVAVTFDQSLTLKRGEGLAPLIGLSLPHLAHGPPLGALKTVNQLGVVGEMVLQRLPLSCARLFHSTPARSPRKSRARP